eukprot:15366621-Ditylum_brightwellii.AAC.1
MGNPVAQNPFYVCLRAEEPTACTTGISVFVWFGTRTSSLSSQELDQCHHNTADTHFRTSHAITQGTNAILAEANNTKTMGDLSIGLKFLANLGVQTDMHGSSLRQMHTTTTT